MKISNLININRTPLTTEDLYAKPRQGIDFGENVRFYLLRGLELKLDRDSKRGFVYKSANKNKKVIGEIIDYRPINPET